ncbi:hypothetical protein ADK64_37045 [Streptomyces sp. MMG1121]|nr:hypothetical protein ADK64_37045 [Streptomyces sp. MMG1121]
MAYVAEQVKLAPEEFTAYDWFGRAISRHRMEILGVFGFRECTVEDQVQWAEWLARTSSTVWSPPRRVT